MPPPQTFDIPLTRPPFPLEEYQQRQEAVTARVSEDRLDALLVTGNTNQEYLSGYDGHGSYFRPFPIIFVPGRPLTYVVREFDADSVRAESVIENVVPYLHQLEFAPTVARVLREFGVERGRIGLELNTWQLAPADVTALEAELPDATIVDATRLVPRLRAILRPVEIEAMRASMAGTDAAIRAFWANIVEGRTEAQAAEAVNAAIVAAGTEARSGLTLLFGGRTALPHGGPKDFALIRDQPAYTEVGGVKHGYAAGLCRSAVLGRHQGAEDLHKLSEEMIEAVVAAIKPGALARDVDAAARSVVRRAGREETYRQRTGYQTGINWTARGNLSLEPDEEEVLQENMTLHMPMILIEQGKFGIATSESVLVTATGAEILSSTPHTLYQVD